MAAACARVLPPHRRQPLVVALTYTDGTRAPLGATVEAHPDASTHPHPPPTQALAGGHESSLMRSLKPEHNCAA